VDDLQPLCLAGYMIDPAMWTTSTRAQALGERRVEALAKIARDLH
jgi:hypothetical protein